MSATDTAPITPREAWAILRDAALAPAGFSAWCAAGGLDPDRALWALVTAIERRRAQRRDVVRWFPCARPGCTSQFAFAATARAEDAVCVFCRDADRAATRLAFVAEPQRGAA